MSSTIFLAIIFGAWNSRNVALVLKYQTVEYIKDKMVEFRLYEDGTFTVNDVVKPWYKTSLMPSAKPWIPAKRRNFVSLVRKGVRDGDYD